MAILRSVPAVFSAFVFFWTLCHGSEEPEMSSLAPRGALDAVVDQETIWTDIGHDIDIVCKLPANEKYPEQQLDTCEFWVFPDSKSKAANYCVFRKDGHQDCSYEFEFDTPAMAEGECRLHVKDVKQNAFGMWNCTLTSHDYATFAAGTAVRQWVKPEGFLPVIDNITAFQEGLKVDNKDTEANIKDIQCCIATKGAEPLPELYFQISAEGGVYEKLVMKPSDATKPELCAVWHATFDYLWNGRNLECGLDHVSFTDQDRNKYKSSVQLKVFYNPIVIEQKYFFVHEEDVAFVEVKIMGNPHPRVEWEVLGTAYNESTTETDQVTIENEVLGDVLRSNLTLSKLEGLANGDIVYLNLWVNEDLVETVPFEIRYTADLASASDNLHVILVVTLSLLTLITIVALVTLRIRRKNTTQSLPLTTQDVAVDTASGIEAGTTSVSLRFLRQNKSARRTAVELPRVPEELQPAISPEGEAAGSPAETTESATTTPV